MRKIKGILVCLLVFSSRLIAVDYQPIAFSSTSSYMGDNQATRQMTHYDRTQPVGSLTTISASNFESLNGEGGAFSPAAASGPRRGRPGGAIGEYDFHSPIGDTPWGVMLLLAVGYIAFLTFRRRPLTPNP